MSDKFAGQTTADRERSRDPELAGPLGIVLAGVVAVILAPGTFDWWTTLIGVVLSLVLIAFTPRRRLDWRELLGVVTAGALCLLLVLGRPISGFWDLGETDEWRHEPVESAPASSEQRAPPWGERLNELLEDRGRPNLRPSSDPVIVLSPDGQPYVATGPGRGAGDDAWLAFGVAWAVLFVLLGRRLIIGWLSRARGWLSSRRPSPPGQA